MSRCGIRLRYPVTVAVIADTGECADTRAIGHAESLALAVELAEQSGYGVRGADDGGGSRLLKRDDGTLAGFWITVYPKAHRTDPSI